MKTLLTVHAASNASHAACCLWHLLNVAAALKEGTLTRHLSFAHCFLCFIKQTVLFFRVCCVQVPAADSDSFYPVDVSFATNKTMCEINVDSVTHTVKEAPVKFASKRQLVTSDYTVT